MVNKFNHLEPMEDEMEIKEDGLILELDPTKEYWMIIKVGSFLWKYGKAGYIRKKDGQILFAGNLNEFKFVENTDRIKGIVFTKTFEEETEDEP